MKETQAIDVLIQVALLAQKGGVLSLQDATTVLTAIETLRPSSQNQQELAPKSEVNEGVKTLEPGK